MIRKNKDTAPAKRRFLTGLAMALSITSMLWCESFVSRADATGKVTVGSAKIRQSTDTASEVIGSTSQGKTVTIKSQVTDAAGVAWYEVYIDSNKTGYIRADLVESNNDGDIPQSTASAPETTSDNASDNGQSDATLTDGGTESSGGGTGAEAAAETAMDAQYAALTVNSNVRTKPSKDSAAVTKLNEGTQVIVSGQSNGNDGKTWYFVTFTGADGAEKTGFIRSDLLTLGEMLPPPAEPETPAEPEAPVEPVTPVNNDYELVYKDAEGEWYLLDNTAGGEFSYEHKLSQLLDAVNNQSEEASEDAKTLVKQRIVIVVLVVLAVALIIAVIIMAVKLRDAYYEDYEDDEDDEEEEEEAPVRRRRRAEEEEETPARRRRRPEEEEEAPVRRRRRPEEEEETPVRRRRRPEEEETPARRRRRPEEEETPARRRRRAEEEEEKAQAGAAAAAKRKSKNFLLDDDEFEFEFLNMDEKK